jgi:hypothetical protein
LDDVAAFEPDDAGALLDADFDDEAEEPDGAGAPGGTGAADEAVRPPETVTLGEIFSIVFCDTPAFERSATDA